MKIRRCPLVLVLTWNLLVPPLAYDRVQHRFRWIIDAAPVEWYHEGEFSTLGECHNARGAKILEHERLLTQYGKDYDKDGFQAASIEALRHAHCLSDQDSSEPRERGTKDTR